MLTKHPTYHDIHRCHGGYHPIVCCHQVEIEVLPEDTQVYFADERYVDAVNTQVRFDATVFNAPNNNVSWHVTDLAGGGGAGKIDATGLYTAPAKGAIPHGHTDIVVATAKADPTRRACAKVTLVGFGPEPAPVAQLKIFPQVAYLYYQGGSGLDNHFIDTSNKHQQFTTLIRNSASAQVTWSVDVGTITGAEGFYTAPGTGPAPAAVEVRAELTHDSNVKDSARIILLNYDWPGIVA